MTPEAAQTRADDIEALQRALLLLAVAADGVLLAELISQAETLLKKPAKLATLLAQFTRKHIAPLFGQVRSDLIEVGNLNAAYFDLTPAQAESVTAPLLARLGIAADGSAVEGGLMALYEADTSISVQLTKFVYAQRSAGVGAGTFAKNLRTFISRVPATENVPAKPGLWEKQLDTAVLDLYQQSDRLHQTAFGEKLGLKFYLYLGGVIPTTRPFCRERNGKTFSLDEIKQFGTSRDAFGGYTNKSTGTFAGKPSPYEPVQQLGGYGCKHAISAISDAEARRRRPELF